MDGIHDLGGMDGLGAIERESDEPVFHADWEARVFALSEAVGWTVPMTIDAFRQEVERMPPARYLDGPYYARWLYALEHLIARAGAVTQAELEARLKSGGGVTPRPLHEKACRPDDARTHIMQGADFRRNRAVAAQRFRPGDPVLTRNIHPKNHTRLPRYARGKRGEIARDHGIFVLPDSNAIGAGEEPQHLYSVRFAVRELWGSEASASDCLYIDLFECYLESGAA